MCKRLIFVYGTLQHHGSNHSVLGDSPFKGQGILKDYALYRLPYGYPGILLDEGHQVLGELYEVSDETLKRLDRLESEGFLYRRINVAIQLTHSNPTNIEVETYLYLQEVQLHWKDTNPLSHWTPKDDSYSS